MITTEHETLAPARPEARGANPLVARQRSLSGRHQDLKFTLHRKLLDKINLEALASIETQTQRNEVRAALTQRIEDEQTLLS